MRKGAVWRLLLIGVVAAALSGCQPEGLTVVNKSSVTVRITEVRTDLELAKRIVPGGVAKFGIAAMDKNGCSTSWTLLATDTNGQVVDSLDSPCPGTWVIDGR